MAAFSFDLIGFDLDGTLVDSAPDLAVAVNHALATEGLTSLSVEAIRPMMGGGGRTLMERALAASGGDPAAVDRLYPVMLDHYLAHIADLTRPFPGVVDALDELKAQGVTLAIVTNKLEAPALKLLTELDLTDYFAVVIGGDTLGVGKPDPAPIREMVRRCGNARAAFVGDTIYDVKAARAAGVPCALFLPNGGDSLGAETVFAHYAELVPILATI